MQFHDWFLTSREEVDIFMLSILHLPSTYGEWTTFSSRQFTFVWRRGRSFYGRTLFVGTRYAALAQAISVWIPVRRIHLARTICRFLNQGSWFRIGAGQAEQFYDVADNHHYHMFRM
jgi:hypothetical protein